MTRKTLTVRFEVEVLSLHRKVGNISTAAPERSLAELLEGLFENERCDIDGAEIPDSALIGSFDIIKEN